MLNDLLGQERASMRLQLSKVQRSVNSSSLTAKKGGRKSKLSTDLLNVYQPSEDYMQISQIAPRMKNDDFMWPSSKPKRTPN